MQHIKLEDLVTVTGGAATVSGAKKIDDATTKLLTQLSSDIKDLAKNSTTNSTSQMMPLMMVAMMSRR